MHVEASVAFGRHQGDLDVHLDVRGVHPGGIVDGVGVETHAGAGRLDAAALGQAEIGALADRLGADHGAGDADGVVGTVAGLLVGLARGADIGADAAEPEEVDRRLEDRLHHLGRGGLGLIEAQRRLDLGRERDRLEAAREDAATLRDQVLVVIGPGRAGQGEQPLALDEAPGGIRVRVEEDVAVVEGGHELQAFRQQHAVAEHVARHVADARHGDRVALRVDVDLAEMALDGLPGAPRGDAHGLVVVALAPARGEGVAEPVAALQREAVGDVGEGGGALVGGDHEVGVVGVVPDRSGRRLDPVADDVVGEFEQGPDEELVALGALGEPSLPLRGRGQALGEEPALGTHRHDHGVLHLLRLHQAQDLGAKILRPVRPAQAPAGDVAVAQVQALDAGRIHEDLEERPRQRHAGDLGAGELERGRLARSPIRPGLEEIGPDRGLDQVDEAPQDAVVVEAGDGGERRLDLTADRSLSRLAVAGQGRVETGAEQGDDTGGERPVPAQGRGEVVLAVADAKLAQVAAERPEQRGVAPLHRGLQDEAVVAVGFGPPLGEREQRPFQGLLDLGQIDRHVAGPLQQHVMQPDLSLGELGLGEQNAVGPLVDDPEAEVLESRHPVGQRQGRPAGEDLETGLGGPVGVAAPEIGSTRGGLAQAL